MKLAAIRKLLQTHSLEELQKAENDLLEEKVPAIEIEGADEGEQLTHVLGAIQILTEMQEDGVDLQTATRNFAQRVRDSLN